METTEKEIFIEYALLSGHNVLPERSKLTFSSHLLTHWELFSTVFESWFTQSFTNKSQV